MNDQPSKPCTYGEGDEIEVGVGEVGDEGVGEERQAPGGVDAGGVVDGGYGDFGASAAEDVGDDGSLDGLGAVGNGEEDLLGRRCHRRWRGREGRKRRSSEECGEDRGAYNKAAIFEGSAAWFDQTGFD